MYESLKDIAMIRQYLSCRNDEDLLTGHFFSGGQMRPPICSCCPCLMGTVKDHGRVAIGWRAGEQRSILIWHLSALASLTIER